MNETVNQLPKELKQKLRNHNIELSEIEVNNWKFQVPTSIKIYTQRNSPRLQVRQMTKGQKLSISKGVGGKPTKSQIKHYISVLTRELISHLDTHGTKPSCGQNVPVTYRMKADGKMYAQLSLWGASTSTNGRAKTISRPILPNATQEHLNAIADELTRLWSWRYVNTKKGVNFNELEIPNKPHLSSEVEPLSLTRGQVKEFYKQLPLVSNVVLEAVERPRSDTEKQLHKHIASQLSDKNADLSSFFFNANKRQSAINAFGEINEVTMSRNSFELSLKTDSYSEKYGVTLSHDINSKALLIKDDRSAVKAISNLAIQYITALEIKHNHMERVAIEDVCRKVTSWLTGKILVELGDVTIEQLQNMSDAIYNAFPDLKSLPNYFKSLQDYDIPELQKLGKTLEFLHPITFANKMFAHPEQPTVFPVRIEDLKLFKQPNVEYYAELLRLTELDAAVKRKQDYENLFSGVNLRPPQLGEMRMTQCQYCKTFPSVYYEHNTSEDSHIISIHCQNGCHDHNRGKFETEGTIEEAHKVAIDWHISNLSFYNPLYFRYHSLDYVRAKSGPDAAIKHLLAVHRYLSDQSELFSLHDYYGKTVVKEAITKGNDNVTVFYPNEQIRQAVKLNLAWAKMNVDLL